MRVIILILRKDTRRIWVPLLLWAVIIFLRESVYFQFSRVVAEDPAAKERLYFFYYLLLGIESVIGFVLAGVIAKDDSPRGTNSFWMTRPLPDLHLLSGKLASVVLLTILWPVLLMLPWKLIVANGGSSGPLKLLFWIEWTTGIAMAGFFLGAFTTSFGQLMGWSLGLPIAGSIASLIWSSWIEKPWMPYPAQAPAVHVAIWVTAVSGAILALALLYRTRRAQAALAVFGFFSVIVFSLLISGSRF